MQASKSAPHYLEKEHGDSHSFFGFLAKVDHYLSAWLVLKKSVSGNVLGQNVFKFVFHQEHFNEVICFVSVVCK